MGDLSDFERGQIVDARLAGVFVIKTATLLGVSRTTVSTVMLAYMNYGKTTSAKRTVGENQHSQKEMSHIEKDCSEKSRKNHRITAEQVTG
jgi:hypothetical protein